jgi:prolyl-tRNA editing enzyme YbaK/EbsC (Cys-tRNA(Pro) deacylase)
LAGSVERVRSHLEGLRLQAEFREFDVSTKSSALAAQALGCSVAEIAKSIVFKGKDAVVVVISGDMKVDSERLSLLERVPVSLATADEVREMTGYPIGGVPPFPHSDGVSVYVDQSVLRFRKVWVAGGAPNAVFNVSTADLLRLVGGEPAELASTP